MLTAVEPWSGAYHVNPQVWTTAHFTQFTKIGDRHLPHGAGAARLARGGSFVSLVDGKGGLTIVLQKASYEHSRCIRPALAPYNTEDEEVTFELKGGLAKIESFNGSKPRIFQKMEPLKVKAGGVVKLLLRKDAEYTLSNCGAAAAHGAHPPSPPPSTFTLPHTENFTTASHYLPRYFTARKSTTAS